MTQIDEPNLEQEITNIFITIDNYGTAEEARVDIRKLIANQVRQARLEEQNYHLDKLKTGKWKSYATEVTDRIKALEEV